jgi:hypothetical protein
MQWIIHIGTQKTGSKAIQKYLLSNNIKKNNHKIIFPLSGRENLWHNPIFNEIQFGKSQLLENAVHEAEAHSADFGIISSESLYTLNLNQIKLIFNTLGPSKIVLFIRRQDQLINSLYNQYIKAHKVNFEYIKNFEKSILKYNRKFDHMATVTRWAKIFGKENITPIIYNKKNCSIKLFFENIGIKNIFTKEKLKTLNPNPALDIEGIKILRLVKQLNINDSDIPSLVNSANLLLKNNFVDTYSLGDQYLLSLQQRKIIFNNYIDSNSELHRTFFKDKKTLFEDIDFNEVMYTDNRIDCDLVYSIFKYSGVPFPSVRFKELGY